MGWGLHYWVEITCKSGVNEWPRVLRIFSLYTSEAMLVICYFLSLVYTTQARSCRTDEYWVPIKSKGIYARTSRAWDEIYMMSMTTGFISLSSYDFSRLWHEGICYQYFIFCYFIFCYNGILFVATVSLFCLYTLVYIELLLQTHYKTTSHNAYPHTHKSPPLNTSRNRENHNCYNSHGIGSLSANFHIIYLRFSIPIRYGNGA